MIISCMICAQNKVYIDPDEFNAESEIFRFHTGNNIWLETHSVHRDHQGLYTFDVDVIRSLCGRTLKTEYQKSWKCPYCYHYWPLGTSCQNKDCPSKYR